MVVGNFDSMYKNILVTGGAGAIGGNLVRMLLSETNARIIVLDNLSSGHKENIPQNERVVFIWGDIADEAVWRECVKYNIDAIYHLAAFFANQNSVEHPLNDLKTNIEGTVRLLEFARHNDIKRIIYFSTSCIYRASSDSPMDEADLNYKMETPYAISKLTGEHYAKYYREFHRVPVVIFRIFNSYGPGERPGIYRNVIPNFFAKAMRGQSLVITGTGEETRCFTYVDDVTRAALAAAISEHAPGRVINVGTDKEVRIIDLAKNINEITGNPAPIEFVPRRTWDQTVRRLPNNQLARTLLNFNSTVDLGEGLRRTYEWFRGLHL